jgi:hypothetical protein
VYVCVCERERENAIFSRFELQHRQHRENTYEKPFELFAVTENRTKQFVVRTIFESFAMDVIVDRVLS